MIEEIEQRIAQLKLELDQLIAEANRQIGMKQGAIQELERIRVELKEKETETK